MTDCTEKKPLALASFSRPVVPAEAVTLIGVDLGRSSLLEKLVCVRGVYLRTSSQPYSGYWFDSLKDGHSDQELTLRIPDALSGERDKRMHRILIYVIVTIAAAVLLSLL